MKKYELTDESIEMFGRKLYRIKAVRSFGDVEEGTLGGFVENETNLSHFGNAWIAGDAVVCEHGWVEGNAIVDENAVIRGNAMVRGNSTVSDSAIVCEDACVEEYATIYEDAVIRGYSTVGGSAWIGKNAMILNSLHYLTVGPLNRKGDFFTFFRTRERTIRVAQGSFVCEMDNFLKLIKPSLKGTEETRGYEAVIELAKIQIDLNEGI